MKKLWIIAAGLLLSSSAICQDFKTNVATAKSSYTSGNLEVAHFALQQMLQEIDITIGKEVLKLLPQKMNDLEANTANDNVSGNISFLGATIHRSYGTGDKTATIEIINNSPMIGTLNAVLTNPLLSGMGSDGKTRVIKVQGYKARLTKEDDNEGSAPAYRLEIPLSNALITLNVQKVAEAEVLAMAHLVPLDKIAGLIK